MKRFLLFLAAAAGALVVVNRQRVAKAEAEATLWAEATDKLD